MASFRYIFGVFLARDKPPTLFARPGYLAVFPFNGPEPLHTFNRITEHIISYFFQKNKNRHAPLKHHTKFIRGLFKFIQLAEEQHSHTLHNCLTQRVFTNVIADLVQPCGI